MCGILGLYNPTGALPPPDAFDSALDRLKLRGPDDSGAWRDECVLLGHRRLAIVDLSPAGHQPMESSDRRYVIVFNGEIYNHRELRPRLNPRSAWRGSSDTETLIEAYRTGRTHDLDSYSDTALRRVWGAARMSWWLTMLLHRFPDETPFEEQMRFNQFDYLHASERAQASLAEQYAGLPF